MLTAMQLRQYCSPEGLPEFKKILSIPRGNRIPALTQQSYENTLLVISCAVGLFLAPCGITDDCAIAVAESIVETAAEDSLTIQDIAIFLKGAAAGKYGKFSWGQITPNAVMVMLEDYREERHRWYMTHKEEQEAHNRGMKDVVITVRMQQRQDPEIIKSQLDKIKLMYGEQQEDI